MFAISSAHILPNPGSVVAPFYILSWSVHLKEPRKQVNKMNCLRCRLQHAEMLERARFPFFSKGVSLLICQHVGKNRKFFFRKLFTVWTEIGFELRNCTSSAHRNVMIFYSEILFIFLRNLLNLAALNSEAPVYSVVFWKFFAVWTKAPMFNRRTLSNG